jgi:hypothetical protein
MIHDVGNRQEFYVRFKGPEESQYICIIGYLDRAVRLMESSTLPRWTVESPRRATRPIPLQVTQHRLRKPHIPPKH